MDETDQALIPDPQQSGFVPTENEGPANPSDEAEDRSKSPVGGRSYDDDEVAVDPENAPSANAFMVEITAAMFVVVVMLIVTALTGSTILLVLTFLSILMGLGVVLRAVFSMMSTD